MPSSWLVFILSTLIVVQAVLLAHNAAAAEIINKKLFDFPDLGTKPRMESRCAKWAKFNSVKCRGLKCSRRSAKVCVNPTHVKVALLRRDVYAVVIGPNTVEAAIVKAAEGYILGCIASAAAASALGPQSVAAPASFVAAFKACVLAVSAKGAVGALLRQVSVKIDTSKTHWSPL